MKIPMPILDAERGMLRALLWCLPEERRDAFARLRGSTFEIPENRILFETIAECSGLAAEALLAELPGILTGKGFPEFEIHWLTEAASVSPGDAMRNWEEARREAKGEPG